MDLILLMTVISSVTSLIGLLLLLAFARWLVDKTNDSGSLLDLAALVRALAGWWRRR